MPARNPPADIRIMALEYPGVTEGTSCNKAAFKAGKKSFVFLGEQDDGWNLMVKLSDSLDEAELMAETKPDNVSVGQHGWTTLRFANGKGPAKKVLKRWIDESYRLLATKKLIAQLDGEGP